MSVLNNSTILVTGGTGSFGQAFIKTVLATEKPKRIIVFSRDEMKQWEMAKTFTDPRIRFFIGDVRDRDRLRLAFRNVDYIIHAAATKIVPTAEYNPFECIKTNVMGAMNVAEMATLCGVKKVVALSTDKASSPINLYGASKLCSDKLFIASNSYSDTKFSVVRYGNVMGSRGSVIPFFLSLPPEEPTPITEKTMTRFMIRMEEAVWLVMHALEDMHGGETYIKKIPSMYIMEIAKALRPDAKIKVTGIRPGEKMHEQMIGEEDAPFTYEYLYYYKILPNLYNWHKSPARIKDGKPVGHRFKYDSKANWDWMSQDELQEWVKENYK